MASKTIRNITNRPYSVKNFIGSGRLSLAVCHGNRFSRMVDQALQSDGLCIQILDRHEELEPRPGREPALTAVIPPRAGSIVEPRVFCGATD